MVSNWIAINIPVLKYYGLSVSLVLRTFCQFFYCCVGDQKTNTKTRTMFDFFLKVTQVRIYEQLVERKEEIGYNEEEEGKEN